MTRAARGVSGIVVLLLALVAGCSSGGGKSEPQERHPLEAVRLTSGGAALAGDLATATVAYVRSNPALTSTDDDWHVRSIKGDAGAARHVRLDQLHAGVKVWGADIVVHIDDSNHVTSTGGNVVRGLAGLDVTPTVAADRAMKIAKSDYASKVRVASAPLTYKREKTELVILPRAALETRLAWHVEFFTEHQAGTYPGRWNYFVDATTGGLLKQFNAIDTLSQASGPGGNPNVSRTWTAKLDVEPQTGGPFVMSTSKYQTYDMNNTESNGVLVTGPLNPIGDAAINDAHGFAEITVNMLNNWFGHNSIDDAGLIIQSRVHYSVNFENAFWDGVEMTYGDGDTALYPLSGDVDVVAHEINHGFTELHSGLIYDGESGGLNESFSDIVGTAADFFVEGDAGDWDIGADLFISPGVIRYMCDPTADGISIDHYSDYAGQDVHFSSGISNKAFCRAARRLASGSPTGAATQASVRLAARAWVEANANHWVQSSTFQQGCQGVMDAATAMGFTVQQKNRIRASWVDVGVYCDGEVEPIVCDTTLTTNSGTIQSPNYPSDYPNDYSHIWCIQPASGNAATLVFDAFSTEADYDFVQIKNGNNGIVLSNTSGGVAPPDSTSTYIVVKFTSDQSVTAGGWQAHWTTGGPGTPDASPGTPDASPGTPDASPGTPDASPGTPDAEGTSPDGDPGPGDDDGGCCSTGSNPMGSLPLIALVGLLLIRPRRRRS